MVLCSNLVVVYDDGGYSGVSLDRPALQTLLDADRQRRIDIIVVYKVDRLTRSLADFAKVVELFDTHSVSFVSITQSFNTTTSMGRLTLDMLLSFAQFEREVTGERIRDKIAASKRKGLRVGGVVAIRRRNVSPIAHSRAKTAANKYPSIGLGLPSDSRRELQACSQRTQIDDVLGPAPLSERRECAERTGIRL